MSRIGQESDSLALLLPPALVEALADRVADRVVEQMPQPAEPFLDVDGAAEHLVCAPSRIYELVSAGRVRVHRDGRRLLFRRVDLDAVLDTREADPC